MDQSGVRASALLFFLGLFCIVVGHVNKLRNPRAAIPECGTANPNGNFIDLTEPTNPGPFHDLTAFELRKLRDFLEKDPNIKAVRSSNATISSSYIFTADLYLPKKSDVLKHLDKGGRQPERQALAVIFRGDRHPPMVEEYVCGPLPDITKCELLKRTTQRNPVEFSVRPMNGIEINALETTFLPKVDDKIGKVLVESYGAKFTGCVNRKDCLASSSAPVGSGLSGDLNKRLMWVTAMYNLPYPSLHILDFAVLVNLNDTNPEKWTVEKVWYSNKIFPSLDDLLEQYNNNAIHKTKLKKPTDDENLFSSLKRRGDPHPSKPQRPPRLVEPDGKRYSVKNKKIEYMGWTFHYRLSPLHGPALYDIRYKGERIVYEVALSDIAVMYSGFAPFGQTLNEVAGSRMLGSRSRAVVQGAGCQESGTSLNAVFMSQYSEEPVYESAFCLFENNDGHAMRGHHAYTTNEGAFYNGIMDTQFILRSAISVLNSDFIIDFLFHQNGVIHVRTAATGYVQPSFFSSAEKPYGHRIHDNLLGNIRQSLLNVKIDLDVGGVSNRYETLDIVEERGTLAAFEGTPYTQTKIVSSVKKTEQEAVYDADVSSPKFHIVYNKDNKNKFNESRAYRIEMRGMSKSMLKENWGNERSIPWARHQMVVTRQKDEEAYSSSMYAMLDSQKPVVNFTTFYQDNENIVDEDLVFWVTSGSQDVARSEDIPNIAAISNQLSVFLLPHNYFPEDPSMGSRDAMYIEYKDPKDPSKGVKVDRNGNSRDQCILTKPYLEDEAETIPDRFLESRRRNPTDI